MAEQIDVILRVDDRWKMGGGVETMTRNIQLLGGDFEGFLKTLNENIY